LNDGGNSEFLFRRVWLFDLMQPVARLVFFAGTMLNVERESHTS